MDYTHSGYIFQLCIPFKLFFFIHSFWKRPHWSRETFNRRRSWYWNKRWRWTDPTFSWYIFQLCIPFKLFIILFIVSRYGHIEVAKLLIDAGADIESKNDNGWTPLILGIFFNYAFLLKYIFFIYSFLFWSHWSGEIIDRTRSWCWIKKW